MILTLEFYVFLLFPPPKHQKSVTKRRTAPSAMNEKECVWLSLIYIHEFRSLEVFIPHRIICFEGHKNYSNWVKNRHVERELVNFNENHIWISKNYLRVIEFRINTCETWTILSRLEKAININTSHLWFKLCNCQKSDKKFFASSSSLDMHDSDVCFYIDALSSVLLRFCVTLQKRFINLSTSEFLSISANSVLETNFRYSWKI